MVMIVVLLPAVTGLPGSVYSALFVVIKSIFTNTLLGDSQAQADLSLGNYSTPKAKQAKIIV
jgi:hypothetical protein